MSATKKPLTFDLGASPLTPDETARAQPEKPARQPKRAEPAAARQQVGARVRAETYKQLKVRAVMQGRKVQDLIEQAIDEFLERHAEGKGP